MSFTVADLTSRINEELKLYGAFESATITNIIKSAVIDYIKKVYNPIISAVLAVNDSTLKYSIPSSIDQIEDVRDENGNSVVLTMIDTLGRNLYLQSVASGSVNYTVYGTPKDIKTNLSTVVQAIDENDENVVWSYIEAYAAKSSQDNEWVVLLKAADKTALEALQARNRSLSMHNTSMRFIDTTGQRIDDVSNVEGITPDISEYLGADF